jgi:hypothetical protein
LNDDVLAGPAGVFKSAHDKNSELRRNDVEPFAAIFADAMQRVPTARATLVVDVDDRLDPRQVRRQRSAVHAPFGGACGVLRGRSLFGLSFAGGRGLLDLFQPKQHLIFGQGLRPSAKPMALQFLDDLKKPIVLRPFGDQHRLQ